MKESSYIWAIIASQLVIFMTLPGLALFYGGLVRKKNVLSILAQCFAIGSITFIVWVLCGFSLSFSKGPFNDWIGGGSYLWGRVPLAQGALLQNLLFQVGFAIITPALIIGGFAERIRFSALLLFVVFWEILVYAPICHWMWGGGFLQKWGVLDFAGGTVVHINSGIAGLVSAIVIGKRHTDETEPHNITLVAMGTGILWFGWIGFNAGAATGEEAIMAALVTHLAAAASALTWMFVEWYRFRKFSLMGLFFGAVTGLVAITPASGFVTPLAAISIGIVAGILCPLAFVIKRYYGYDDTLDSFGIHGFGGIVGSLLTGVFASPLLGGRGTLYAHSMIHQIALQALGILVTLLWSGGMTYLILKLMQKCGVILRAHPHEENAGLDISYHGETGYRF